jgi:formylglycine-generating enzyme required for sulfatase activity
MKSQPALALILLLQIAGPLQATAPKTVPVGDAGNAADATGYGAVAYHYRIGKYEVTNAEYCEFLNAVVKSDPVVSRNTITTVYADLQSVGETGWSGFRFVNRRSRGTRLHQ